MTRGPLGGNRPFIETTLKYDVTVLGPEEIVFEDPKAIDVLDKRVNAPQDTLTENVEDQIGKVLLAVHNARHPNTYRVIDTEYKDDTDSLVNSGQAGYEWTYVLQGTGMLSSINKMTSSRSVMEAHKVLIEGDNTPIERAAAISEFDSGPLEVQRVNISTE